MKIETNKSTKNIVVIGANGGIGKQSVELALQYGHKVTAILRNPGNLTLKHANLKLVKGDVMDPETLVEHFKNSDAIISAIGKNSFKPTTLYSQGNKNVLAAMQKAGATRAFFISASGLNVNPTHSFMVRLATKYILQKLLKNMYADLERMEEIIKTTDLNWTIIRPVRLTDKAATGLYRFAVDGIIKNGLSISRADVAHYMLNAISNEDTYKATVEIAY